MRKMPDGGGNADFRISAASPEIQYSGKEGMNDECGSIIWTEFSGICHCLYFCGGSGGCGLFCRDQMEKKQGCESGVGKRCGERRKLGMTVQQEDVHENMDIFFII